MLLFCRLLSKSDVRLEAKELDSLERAMVAPKNKNEVMCPTVDLIIFNNYSLTNQFFFFYPCYFLFAG